MHINSKLYNGTLYVVLNGELDENAFSYTRETLDLLFAKRGIQQIIFDLSELKFMDSTGIGLFLGRYKRMKKLGVPIYVANPSTQIEKIFKMSGIYNLMPKIAEEE